MPRGIPTSLGPLSNMILLPARMAQSNRRTLVRTLQRLGLASRADLAKALGMSQPTTGKIVDELVALGLLAEVGEGRSDPTFPDHGPTPEPSRRSSTPITKPPSDTPPSGIPLRRNGNPAPRLGRPGRLLQLESTHPRLVGIELGVTMTRVGLLSLTGTSVDAWTTEWPTQNSLEAWFQSMADAALKLRPLDVQGAVASVPGIVDETAGRVVYSPNLHWTEGAPLPERLAAIWQVPAVLVQEERALALGHLLKCRQEEDFLLVDFGEGVGGAMVLGGRLYSGPLPLSGELGHTPVIGNRRRCGCGAVGCVESLVSQDGLLRSLAQAQGRRSRRWSALVQALQLENVPDWLKETLEATAVVIAGALNVLGLRRVVITGSLTHLPPAVCQYLSDAIIRGSLWGRFGAVHCDIADRQRALGLVAVGLDRVLLPEAGPGHPGTASLPQIKTYRSPRNTQDGVRHTGSSRKPTALP